MSVQVIRRGAFTFLMCGSLACGKGEGATNDPIVQAGAGASGAAAESSPAPTGGMTGGGDSAGSLGGGGARAVGVSGGGGGSGGGGSGGAFASPSADGGAPAAGASGASGGLPAAGSGETGSSVGAQSPLPESGTAAMQPIDPPVADDCIADVTPGDHTFGCDGLTFLVVVPEACTKFACGLIFDVHGGTMSGAQMRDNTHLHELAPEHGYLVVHPSATAANTGGTWDLNVHPPLIGKFMDRMIKAFHVDPKRIHVTGFSQGSGVTFWFLCNKPTLLTSAAPISGQSADQITGPDGMPCLSSIGEGWKPRVPILFMSGTLDTALVIEDARARVDGLVTRLGLTGGDQIEGDETYRRKRWQSEDGMVLDYLEHDYGGQAVLGGHCIPGGTDVAGSANNFILNATTCTTPARIGINWGQTVLQWFRDIEAR